MVFTGNNAPIETNAKGGKGSVTYGGFHLGFPSRGALEVSHVVKQGSERYEVNNWRLLSPEDHYNHALEHLMRLGDPNEPSNNVNSESYEDHAAHAACRLLMFLETRQPDRKLAFHVQSEPTPPAPPFQQAYVPFEGFDRYHSGQAAAAKQAWATNVAQMPRC